MQTITINKNLEVNPILIFSDEGKRIGMGSSVILYEYEGAFWTGIISKDFSGYFDCYENISKAINRCALLTYRGRYMGVESTDYPEIDIIIEYFKKVFELICKEVEPIFLIENTYEIYEEMKEMAPESVRSFKSLLDFESALEEEIKLKRINK